MFHCGSAELLLCTRASAFAYVNVPSCPVVFFEAFVQVHLSGVCLPLHFAVFVRAPVLVNALSYNRLQK